MKIIIDRIEENFLKAELPDGSFLNLPLALFENPSEGDVFIIEKSIEETDKKELEINKLMSKIFKK